MYLCICMKKSFGFFFLPVFWYFFYIHAIHLCLWPFMEHESGYDLINYVHVCHTLTRGLEWLTMWAIIPFVCPDYFLYSVIFADLQNTVLLPLIYFLIKFSLLD